ncbi:MAG TPA: aminotransferase class I/II-fold pyridoxal phosphate-dependent enzyme [Chloroflexota bacterium]|nr:aminotransferase class I/II-fold pyridoxal phosphate-dependent enzyme [Chloroflexota bacterium]
MTVTRERLAINGGPPAKTTPPPPMYPGGMAIGIEEEEAVLEVLRRKRLFRYYGADDGPSKTAEFEDAFARHMGAAYARAVCSGTAAITCALVGAGVGPGDEVIVPAYTWIASAAAALAVGAIPILAEVDASLTLDPDDVRRKITPLTRAILPVHMRGAASDMNALLAVAREHGLPVVEDVAQADGGSYHGRRLGTIGDVGAYSLQFNKIITTGEGGMVVSDNRDIWLRASVYHDPITAGMGRGIDPEEAPVFPGLNLRASEFVGAVGLVQLGRLEGLLEAMRRRKQRIKAAIQGIPGLGFRTIHDEAGDTGICIIMFLPTAEKAAEFGAALTAENVPAWHLYRPDHPDFHVYAHWTSILNKTSSTAAGYPWAPAYYRGTASYSADMCPRTLDLLGRAVNIDVNPLYSDEDVEQVIAAIHKVADALDVGGATGG